MVDIQQESTEYCYIGLTGGIPSVSAEIAFLPFGTRPTTEWSAAEIVDDQHALWVDAQASGLAGDYFLARLVGSHGGTGLVLTPDDYQPWIRLTDAVEQPVLIAPVTLTVVGP